MPDSDSPERPGKLKMFWLVCWKTLGLTSWIIPFIIMGVSYKLFPPMQATISNLENIPHDVFFGLFVTLGAIGAWLGYELWYAVSRNTSVGQLQADGLISTFFAIILTFIGSRWIVQGSLPYWFVLPWIGTVLDSLASGFFAINNAAQKPLVQNERK